MVLAIRDIRRVGLSKTRSIKELVQTSLLEQVLFLSSDVVSLPSREQQTERRDWWPENRFGACKQRSGLCLSSKSNCLLIADNVLHRPVFSQESAKTSDSQSERKEKKVIESKLSEIREQIRVTMRSSLYFLIQQESLVAGSRSFWEYDESGKALVPIIENSWKSFSFFIQHRIKLFTCNYFIK